MSRLRDEEVRRLLRYLRQRIEDQEYLAEIEDEQQGEDAEECLREPDCLRTFQNKLRSLLPPLPIGCYGSFPMHTYGWFKGVSDKRRS